MKSVSDVFAGVFKVLAWMALAVVALLIYRVYSSLGPVKYPYGYASEACQLAYRIVGFELSGSDQIDWSWQDGQHLDPAAYCRLKTTPERIRVFKEKLRAAPPDPDAPKNRTDALSCEGYPPAKPDLPEWWQGPERPGSACYSYTEGRNHPRGVNLVLFEEEGYIFAVRWRT